MRKESRNTKHMQYNQSAVHIRKVSLKVDLCSVFCFQFENVHLPATVGAAVVVGGVVGTTKKAANLTT